MSEKQHPAVSEPEILNQLIMGFRNTQLIHVAARLALSDHLQKPQTAEELAAVVEAEPAALYRVLRALASLGLYEEANDGRFTVTSLGRYLQTGVQGSLRDAALLYGAEWLWQVYGHLHYSVRTGNPAYAEVHGRPYYEHLSDNPLIAAQFNAAMSGNSRREAAAILGAIDFSDVRTLVDVGGGQGGLLAAILNDYPSLHGVLLDLEPAVEVACDLFQDAGLSTRTRCVAGNFFEEVPEGAEMYLLKSVLHNWKDTDAIRILSTCRRAMRSEDRLLILERIVPVGNAPSEAKLFDINMLAVAGGLERSIEEYGALLSASDMDLRRVVATTSHLSVIEAVARRAVAA